MSFLLRHKTAAVITLAISGVLGLLLFLVPLFNVKTWSIWLPEATEPLEVKSAQTIPASILQEGNVALREGDQVFHNGFLIDPNAPLVSESHALQIKRSVEITLDDAGNISKFLSAAGTLGEALWQQGIILKASDSLNPSAQTTLEQPLSVELRRGQPVRIVSATGESLLNTAASTVGQALAEAGISLQGLDYSLPAEDQPIPTDRSIKIVRVREEVVLSQTTIAFPVEQIADAEMELDQSKLIQAGELGLKASRQRVRYEDGKEVARATESEWVAREPKAQKLAYGTKIVIRSMSTPAGTIEYWRAVTVWITSYRDTGSRTSSGTWPVKGDIAVKLDWYRALKGMRIYVPGYVIGVVSDVCPGCVGKPWIDIFYPTAEYVGWAKTQTVYFLTPVPANPLLVLP